MKATQLRPSDFGFGSGAALLFATLAWSVLSGPEPELPPRSVSVVAAIAVAGAGDTAAAPASTPEASPLPEREEPRRPLRRSDPRKPSKKMRAPAPVSDGTDASGEGPAGPGGGEGGSSLDAEGIAAYRAELLSWLSGRFVVERSGLDADTLAALRVRASVDVAEDGTVSGFSLVSPSGHEVVDRAVRDALEPLMGRRVPTPPEGYPGTLPPKLSVTFVCTQSRCS